MLLEMLINNFLYKGHLKIIASISLVKNANTRRCISFQITDIFN